MLYYTNQNGSVSPVDSRLCASNSVNNKQLINSYINCMSSTFASSFIRFRFLPLSPEASGLSRRAVLRAWAVSWAVTAEVKSGSCILGVSRLFPGTLGRNEMSLPNQVAGRWPCHQHECTASVIIKNREGKDRGASSELYTMLISGSSCQHIL